MTLAELVEALDTEGVRLSARLVVDAPVGVLTPEMRDALAAHKSLLLQRVVQELVWMTISSIRWADADESSGIDNPGRQPSPEIFAQALSADPYATAEREAIRDESRP